MAFENLPVIIWSALAVVGAAVAFRSLLGARRDLIRVRDELGEQVNGELLIARGWVRDEAVRFTIQLGWAVVGLLALLEHGVVAIVPILLMTNALVLYNTVMNARDRSNLRKHWIP